MATLSQVEWEAPSIEEQVETVSTSRLGWSETTRSLVPNGVNPDLRENRKNERDFWNRLRC
jgi:hypothetical protein